MALYVGEAVRIRASAVDPETKAPLDPPPTSAKVDFWAPGKNPAKDATVRSAPDVPNKPMEYRSATGDYVLYQETSGDPWVAGKWAYRVTIVGESYTNWEFGSFVLKP
jgi:hypothetical protein